MSGVLPSGWRACTLGDVLSDVCSGFACGDDVEDGVIQFRMNNVTREGTLDWTKVRRIPRARKNLEALYVQPGDLLFNSTNSPDLIGKCAVFDGFDEPVTFSNHFLRLRPDHTASDSHYLARWITLQWSRGVFAGMCRQWVNQASVSKEQVLGLSIPLPPLVEQRRIAAILDQAQALRAKRRRALAQLDTLTQSLFLWVHRSSKREATEVPLADVAEQSRGSFVNGPFGSDLLTSELQDAGVPVIYIRDIRDGEYRRVSPAHVSERKARDLAVCQVTPGDVLVAKVGDPPGISAVYPTYEPLAIVTQDVIRIRVNPSITVPEFLSCYLNSSVGQWHIKQITIEATRARFSLGDFKRLRITLPPLPLQHEFAAHVSAVERLKAVQRASLAKLDALFASLQNRAFRGEL